MKLDPHTEQLIRGYLDQGLEVIAVPREHLAAMLDDIDTGRQAQRQLDRYQRSVDSLGGGPA